jgi:hypothetical protein
MVGYLTVHLIAKSLHHCAAGLLYEKFWLAFLDSLMKGSDMVGIKYSAKTAAQFQRAAVIDTQMSERLLKVDLAFFRACCAGVGLSSFSFCGTERAYLSLTQKVSTLPFR